MSQIDDAVEAATKIDGWMNGAELRWLAERAGKAKVIIELGAWKGRTTKALAGTTEGTVHSVDLWDGIVDGAKRCDEVPWEFFNNLRQEIKSGRVWPWPIPTRHLLASMYMLVPDMIFIDAGHTYEEVSLDIRSSLALLRRGGLLCGHDFSNDYPDVQKAVQDLVPGFARAPGGDIWYKEL